MLLDDTVLSPAVTGTPVSLVITEIINVMVPQQAVNAVLVTNA